MVKSRSKTSGFNAPDLIHNPGSLVSGLGLDLVTLPISFHNFFSIKDFARPTVENYCSAFARKHKSRKFKINTKYVLPGRTT